MKLDIQKEMRIILEIGKCYKVIKSNSDASILPGDIVAFDTYGRLWKDKSEDGSQSAWIDPDDLTDRILDFETE